MKIFTYGNAENEKILLIHPMFTSAKFFDGAVNLLKDRYFLIVPTLSGHCEGGEYVSAKKEIAEINSFLAAEKIEKLKAVIGFSLGGNLVFEFFTQNPEMADKLIADSAPMFKFPQFVRRGFLKKYGKCLEKVRLYPERAAETLNKCFNCMGEFQKEIAPKISGESLKNLVESCFDRDLPALDEAMQRKIIFIYGSKDISRLCSYRIKKYKFAKFVYLKGYSHCQLFTSKTKEYLLRFLGD